ncbi:hemerythrin domain-containing protein [Actinospica sp. MGRD01-02]|uniref:Hemerythrin domain-containing protein n=1 Tax=Actinospica acidithermotolerans TaxID=2828514 RepID=A0A941IKE8_9ACTN|nr:hemerythrin domain-containing protein [Actinospica acidithermotolerans]MBR7828043.1 hemerythrin domain-containing protein [Actinospica acidithermotolerans]
MTQAHQERLQADELPAGSVVSVLLEQHAKIRELFEQTAEARGAARRRAFDELRELLAVHEAGEEIVVRPVTKAAADGKIADERNHEEKEAAKELAELESRDISSRGFAESLAELESDVSDHADAEERDEFPYLLSAVDQDTQMKMGARLLKVQRAAPTHPHPTAAGSPTAQAVLGPFAALLDRARDAFRKPADG